MVATLSQDQVKDQILLQIGQVAVQSQVPIKTIRYYEELGLLKSSGRTEGRFRLFAPDTIKRITFIKRVQKLGLSLQEIAEILEVHDRGFTPCTEIKQQPNDSGMKWMMAMMVACCTIPIAIAIFAGGGLGFLFGRSNPQPPQITNQTSNTPQAQKAISKVSLTPAQNWQTDNHVHGLTVNPENPNIIYVASHNGLLQRAESGQWFWVGKDRSDYMGFTGDRTVMYGYRFEEANAGIYRSNDDGKNWEKLWTETNGVIVKLAVAPSNSQILYAANEKNQVFQSQDSGKTWKTLT